MSRFTEEEKEVHLKEYWSHVDYKPGDWVETCNLLPGIVQNIDIKFDERGDYFHETVEIFYPHYALDKEKNSRGTYNGKSHCSVCSCGVHKIEPGYAIKLMSLGEDRLKALWDKMCKDAENTNDVPCWEKYVEKEYDLVFNDK